MSGVIIDASCVQGARQALGRRDRDCGWATFRLEGDDKIVLDATGRGSKNAPTAEEMVAGWNEFVQALPEDEVRWAVYEFAYMSPQDNVVRSKSLFVLYCPGSCKIKQKTMSALYAKKLSMSTCEGDPINVQAGSAAQLDWEEVFAKVLSKCTVK